MAARSGPARPACPSHRSRRRTGPVPPAGPEADHDPPRRSLRAPAPGPGRAHPARADARGRGRRRRYPRPGLCPPRHRGGGRAAPLRRGPAAARARLRHLLGGPRGRLRAGRRGPGRRGDPPSRAPAADVLVRADAGPLAPAVAGPGRRRDRLRGPLPVLLAGPRGRARPVHGHGRQPGDHRGDRARRLPSRHPPHPPARHPRRPRAGPRPASAPPAALPVEPVVETGGDALARTVVRWREIGESMRLCREALDRLHRLPGPLATRVPPVLPGEAISRVEAPRGELFYYVLADGEPHPTRVRVRTPTFANLAAVLSMLPGTQMANVPVALLSIDPCLSCTER